MCHKAGVELSRVVNLASVSFSDVYGTWSRVGFYHYSHRSSGSPPATWSPSGSFGLVLVDTGLHKV